MVAVSIEESLEALEGFVCVEVNLERCHHKAGGVVDEDGSTCVLLVL